MIAVRFLCSVVQAIFLVVALLAISTGGVSAGTLILAPTMGGVDLSNHLEVVERPREASPSQYPECRVERGDWIVIRNTPCSSWFKVRVSNPQGVSQTWYLAPKINRQEMPRIFKQEPGGKLLEIPRSDEWIRSFALNAAPLGEEVFYIQITARVHEAIAFAAWSDGDFTRHTIMTTGLALFVIGVLMSMAAYNLAIAISNRDQIAFWYSTLLFALVIPLVFDNNLVFSLFSDWNTGLSILQNSAGYILSIATMSICRLEFVHFPLQKGKEYFLRIASWVLKVALATQFLFDTSPVYQVLRYLFLLPLIYMTVAAMANLRRTIRCQHWTRLTTPAAMIVFPLTVFAVLLRDMGYIHPALPIISVLYLVTPVTLALLMALGHAISVRNLIREKLTSQQELLKIRENYIRELERQVGVRTERFKNEAEEAERLRLAQQNLLGLVSHDLVTPLHGLLKTIDKAKNGDGTLNANTIELSRDVIGEVLTRVSYLSAQEVRQHYQHQLIRRGVDLWHLVDAQIRLFSAASQEKQISVINEIPLSTLIYVDAELFGEVIGNLIGNAIKYCWAGDSVTIRLDGDNIVVTDSGPGVSPVIGPILFRTQGATSRGSAGEKGFGLGLYSSKKIVERHGGSISYRDAQGGGAQFVIELSPYRPVVRLVSPNSSRLQIKCRLEELLGQVVIEHIPLADFAKHPPGFRSCDFIICDCSKEPEGAESILAVFRDNEAWDSVPIFIIGLRPNSSGMLNLIDAGAQSVLATDFSDEALVVAISNSDAKNLLWASKRSVFLKSSALRSRHC